MKKTLKRKKQTKKKGISKEIAQMILVLLAVSLSFAVGMKFQRDICSKQKAADLLRFDKIEQVLLPNKSKAK